MLGGRSINSINWIWVIPCNQAKNLYLIIRDGELTAQVVCLFGNC